MMYSCNYALVKIHFVLKKFQEAVCLLDVYKDTEIQVTLNGLLMLRPQLHVSQNVLLCNVFDIA